MKILGHQPKKVLCIGAHPDDIEFCFGGTVAKFIKHGAEVSYLICTDGSRGSSDKRQTRENVKQKRHQEQVQAAKVLGVNEVFYLDYGDCELKNDDALKKEIVEKIRLVRPDTVITMDPTMLYCLEHNYINHLDHRACGESVVDCVYPLARDATTYSDSGSPHSVRLLLLYNMNTNNVIIDTTEEQIEKHTSLKQHHSQMNNEIFNKLSKIDSSFALNKNFDFGEGFAGILL